MNKKDFYLDNVKISMNKNEEKNILMLIKKHKRKIDEKIKGMIHNNENYELIYLSDKNYNLQARYNTEIKEVNLSLEIKNIKGNQKKFDYLIKEVYMGIEADIREEAELKKSIKKLGIDDQEINHMDQLMG